MLELICEDILHKKFDQRRKAWQNSKALSAQFSYALSIRSLNHILCLSPNKTKNFSCRRGKRYNLTGFLNFSVRSPRLIMNVNLSQQPFTVCNICCSTQTCHSCFSPSLIKFCMAFLFLSMVILSKSEATRAVQPV